MAIEEPDTTPQQRPSPFGKRYLGADGITVHASYDGERILVTAEEEVPEAPARKVAPVEAADEFADVDFLATAGEDDDVNINAGEVSYSSWTSSAGFAQDTYTVPESTVTIADSSNRQYIYLVIQMVTYTSTPTSKLTPWEERSGNSGGAYTIAKFTEWQGIDETEPPSYLVSEDGQLDGEQDVFRCLIASVLDGVVYPHHVGAIALPQGYIANITRVT